MQNQTSPRKETSPRLKWSDAVAAAQPAQPAAVAASNNNNNVNNNNANNNNGNANNGKPAGPPRRRYKALYRPLPPVEFIMQFPTLQISVLDRQKRPAFTTECLTCNVLGRAPHNKDECAEHDHSLTEDAVDHVKHLICLALDSRLPLDSTCIIVPITQRRSNVFSLKMFSAPDKWIESVRNMGLTFNATPETLASLQSEYAYSSVVEYGRELLRQCQAGTAVRCKLGALDFLRAPDTSCSSILLWADAQSATPNLPIPVLLTEKVKFYDMMSARMQIARNECGATHWSVAFFFFDGTAMYGGLKLDEGVFLRLFGVAVEPPPQMKSRDDLEKKQKLRWAREDNVVFDPNLKMTLVYENVRREVNTAVNANAKKCSFFFEKGFCKNGKNCRFSHAK